MRDPIYDEAVWAGMYADPKWIANRGTRRVFVTPVGLSRLDEYRNKYGSPESVVPSGKCDVTATFRPAIVDGALTSGTVSVAVTVDAPNIPGPRDSTGRRLVISWRIKDNDIPLAGMEYGDALPKLRTVVRRAVHEAVGDCGTKEGWTRSVNLLSGLAGRLADRIVEFADRKCGFKLGESPNVRKLADQILSPVDVLLGATQAIYGVSVTSDIIDCLLLPRVIDGQEAEIHNLRLWSIVTMCTFKAMDDIGLRAPRYINLISNGGDPDSIGRTTVTIRALGLLSPDTLEDTMASLSGDDVKDVMEQVNGCWRAGNRPILLLAESVLS